MAALRTLWETHIGFQIGSRDVVRSVREWINEGFDDPLVLRRVACVSEGFYSGLNRWSAGLVPQHDAQERVVDPQAAVVVDEPELPKLVHEEVHPRPCRADHFG